MNPHGAEHQGHGPHEHDHHHDDHEHDHDHDEDGHGHDHKAGAAEYIRLGLLGLVVLSSLTGWWKGYMTRDWLALAATIIGGFPIYEEAWENVRKRRMTMELSMSIALIAALCIGQFLTALVITFFVLFAEMLEGYTVGGGRRAIQKLIDSLPRQVTVRRDGKECELSIQEIKAGESVIIRPGERVPADGEVVKGHSFVDQASITGESLPIEKSEGSKVFAGTINKDGVLEVRVEKFGRDTTFGKIIEIVEQAEKSKAPVQRVADRLAAGLVYFAFASAILTFVITRNLTSTIAVVIVAGACGVAAGTPLAILAGIGSAARRGIIIKGGLYLEQLSKIDTVVFDKTGTLTQGSLNVVSIRKASGISEHEVLQTAAIAEQHSEHPLGEAIVRRSRELKLPIRGYSNLQYVPGKGLTCDDNASKILVGSQALLEEHGILIPADFQKECNAATTQGQTAVFIGRDKQLVGIVILADQLRKEAKETVSRLKQDGHRILLLTGDNPDTAKAIGSSLGIDEVFGGLLPHQKVEQIESLLTSGRKVIMVGDGVNDAPALAKATVGIAMGQGTDVALETAHITLMTGNISRLVEVITIGKRCHRIIMFNFWGTILVDIAGIVLASLGMLTPILAAVIHVGSELAFISNSARLFRHRTN